jgi:hypothetical protein
MVLYWPAQGLTLVVETFVQLKRQLWFDLCPAAVLGSLDCADRPDCGANKSHHQRDATQPQSCSIDGDRHCEGHLQGIRPAEANNKPRGCSTDPSGQSHGAAPPGVCTRLWVDPSLSGKQ